MTYRIAWKSNPRKLVPAYFGKKFSTRKEAENKVKRNIAGYKLKVIKRN
jgi:hypothetical protein